MEEREIIESFDPEMNADRIFETNFKFTRGETGNSGGSSNSFFFFTEDKKFIVKTMNKKDIFTFIKLIPELKKRAFKPSLLAKVHGLFRLKLRTMSSIYFIVMQNALLLTLPKNVMSHKFDLKGSRVNRQMLGKKDLQFGEGMFQQVCR